MQPGSLAMHTCFGTVRFSMEPRLLAHAYCRHPDCRAPVGPEQPFLEGHAGFFCRFCQSWIGFCCAGLVAGLMEDAEQTLRGGPRG